MEQLEFVGIAGHHAELAGTLSYGQRKLLELAYVLVADPAVLRGRRFGNAVLVATDGALPVDGLRRRAAGDPHPARVLSGRELTDLTGGAVPVTDATAGASPAPPPGAFD